MRCRAVDPVPPEQPQIPARLTAGLFGIAIMDCPLGDRVVPIIRDGCGPNFARRLSRIDWQSAPNRAVLSRPWTFTASRDPTPRAPSPLRGFGGDGAFAVATERRIP